METTNINLTKTKRDGAFTLVELLVVIAIMGIIASLVIGLVSRATITRKIKRVRVELAQLETVIESYKEKKGFYPPSNGLTNIVTTNQLFYELTGTIFDPATGVFQSVNGTEKLDDSTIGNYFNTKGFANSGTAADRSEVKNFFPGMRAEQYHDLGTNSVHVLIVPVEGPDDINVGGKKINPWRYNSASPTHNPESYDLWAEIVVGGKTNIIGNWNE